MPTNKKNLRGRNYRHSICRRQAMPSHPNRVLQKNNKRPSSQYGDTDRTTTNNKTKVEERQKESNVFLFGDCRFPQPGPVAQNLQWLRRVGSQLGPSVDPDVASRDRETKTPKRREKKGGVSVVQPRRELSIHTPFYFLLFAT